ncbi:hypothetical protein K9F62_19560 [Desulfovibrio sp. JY]|nr:hypothetical protein K9F62_19560 [Desulfovibrio sp. JY]
MKRVMVLAVAWLLLTGSAWAASKKAFDINPVGCVDGFATSAEKVGAINPESWQLGIKGKTPMLGGQSGKSIVTFVLDRKSAKPTGIIVAASHVAGANKDTMAQASSIMAMHAVVDMTASLSLKQRTKLVTELVDTASQGKEAQYKVGSIAYTLSLVDDTLMFMATPAENLK